MTESKPNILFIVPGFFYIQNYHKMLYYNEIPLGTLQLSAFLKEKAGVQTNIVDLRRESLSIQDSDLVLPNNNNFIDSIVNLFERSNHFEYQNIGIDCYTSSQYLFTDSIAHIIKENAPNINILVFGHHPSVVPEDFDYKNSPYDYIIQGEPENVFLRLFETNKLKKSIQNPMTIFSNEIVDLNQLPFPDYNHYLKKYSGFDTILISMTRGCPFNCKFCRIIKNNPIRSYSFPVFQKQLDRLIKVALEYNKKSPKIGFIDQSFNSATISNKVLSHIIQSEFPEEIRFSCQTRLEILYRHQELIDLFRRSNMIVGVGFESSNKNLLAEMNKTQKPSKYVEQMIELAKLYKDITEVYCRINIIAGFPGETRDTFDETIEFIRKHALHENIQISPSLFLNDPSTYVYQHMDYYKEKFGSKFLKEWWKIRSDPLKNSILLKPSKNYTKKELIGDYKEKYALILPTFKYSPFRDILNWKKYSQHITDFQGNIKHFRDFTEVIESLDLTLIK